MLCQDQSFLGDLFCALATVVIFGQLFFFRFFFLLGIWYALILTAFHIRTQHQRFFFEDEDELILFRINILLTDR